MRVSREQQRELLGLFGHGPVKLLAITAKSDVETATIERFLDGNGALTLVTSTEHTAGWVCIMRERDAQFYVDRLASGNIGSKIVDTLYEADEQLAAVMFP